MITIQIINSDTADIYVAITDKNIGIGRSAMTSMRLHRYDKRGIQVQEDGDGKCNINWVALSADAAKVNSGDVNDKRNGDSVNVSASA
jgi:hypothetical protein